MAQPPPSPALDRADALAQRGQVAEAYELLEQAAARSDARAAARLAEWRLSGGLIRRDLAEARRLYGHAAVLGLDAAEPIHIAMLANGAGGQGRDWLGALALLRARAARDPLAREQVALLDAMAIDDTGDPLRAPEPEPLSAEPRIERVPGFLAAAECRYLAERASPMLQPSVVVHPQTGALVQHPVRRAHAAGFPFVLEDPVIHAINRRIAAATGLPVEHGEPLQVLAYDPGDEYRLHTDTLPPGENQRVATFLAMLDIGFVGGATAFPRLGVKWRGALGEALHFRNVDAIGRPDERASHAGLPVTRGRKLILSRWLRAAPLDLSGPPGRPF
jgi:prolyl 4-hydroxylase